MRYPWDADQCFGKANDEIEEVDILYDDEAGTTSTLISGCISGETIHILELEVDAQMKTFGADSDTAIQFTWRDADAAVEIPIWVGRVINPPTGASSFVADNNVKRKGENNLTPIYTFDNGDVVINGNSSGNKVGVRARYLRKWD